MEETENLPVEEIMNAKRLFTEKEFEAPAQNAYFTEDSFHAHQHLATEET